MAESNNISTARSRLLDLPPELRLEVYSHFGASNPRLLIEPGCDTEMWFGAKLKCSTLTTLSRVCKQLHEEVQDVLYADMNAEIRICNIRTLTDSGFTIDWLKPLQRVHFHLAIDFRYYTDKYFLHFVLNMLRTLSASTSLKVFTFHVCHHHVENEMKEGEKEMNGGRLVREMRDLRKKAVKEGVRAGRNARERELDFALRVLEFLDGLS